MLFKLQPSLHFNCPQQLTIGETRIEFSGELSLGENATGQVQSIKGGYHGDLRPTTLLPHL